MIGGLVGFVCACPIRSLCGYLLWHFVVGSFCASTLVPFPVDREELCAVSSVSVVHLGNNYGPCTLLLIKCIHFTTLSASLHRNIESQW